MRIHYLDNGRTVLDLVAYPACVYPREYDTYEIGPIGAIRLPRSMTRREWAFLLRWLRLTRDSGRVV